MSLDNAFALIERHPGLPRLVNYRSGMLFQCASVKKEKPIFGPPANGCRGKYHLGSRASGQTEKEREDNQCSRREDCFQMPQHKYLLVTVTNPFEKEFNSRHQDS